MGETKAKVITRFVYPPIPIRRFDWCAYFDGEEDGLVGFGATETEALDDLGERVKETAK